MTATFCFTVNQPTESQIIDKSMNQSQVHVVNYSLLTKKSLSNPATAITSPTCSKLASPSRWK